MSSGTTATITANGKGSIRGRLARGTSVHGLTLFGLRALGFALLAIYSHCLSPRDYGIVSLAESIGAVTAVLSGFALENGIRLLYFQFADEPEDLRIYLGTILLFAAAAATIMLAIGLLFGPAITSHIAPRLELSFFPFIALALVTAVSSQLLQCRLVIYQCQERHLVYAAFVALQSLSTTFLTFGLVVWKHYGAVGLLTARTLGACIALLVAACVSGSMLRVRPRWSYVRETLHISLPLVPHGMMALGLVAIDRVILKHYRPLYEVGLYALAYNIGMVMTLVTTTITRAWAPLFYAMLRKGEEDHHTAGSVFTDLVLALALIASAGILIAPLCIHSFLDRHYWPAAALAPIILGAYFCHSLFSLFQLFVIQARRTPLVSTVSATALLTNVVLNLVWIPRYGMVGAAYATLAGYAIELVLIAIIARRVFPLRIGWSRFTVSLLIFVTAFAWTQFHAAEFSLRPLVLPITALAIAATISICRKDLTRFTALSR